MKVLFISANSPFMSIGGIERYVLNLINFFKIQKDVKTFLILPTTENNHITSDGNMTIYYDNSLYVPRKIRSSNILSNKGQQFSDLIEKIIKDNGIEIICAENIVGSVPPVYSLRLNMIAALYKIPLMLRLHVYAEKPIQVELINSLMWNHVSCVSKSVAGDCFQKGTDIKKISTEYLGVNVNDFKPKKDKNYNLKKELGLGEDTKIVLTAGRIITGSKNMLKEKGMINLIEAFARLSPRFPKMRLLIGIAKASNNLKDDFDLAYEMLLGYIKIHDISNKTIVKMFELDQMPNVYRGSDVLVLPAEKNETLGQIFLEAMACGLPVIGAKTGGMPEIISDGYNGFLVPPADPSILAQEIEIILTDKILRNSFIKNAHKTIEEKFTAKNQFTNFNQLLKKVSNEQN
jgi:glycosyltransferase involved in cell wall biosynthesis